jgi:hypothetical protein
MCSARPSIGHVRASTRLFEETERQRKADPLAEHKARMEREHQATLRRNQRGLWIVAAIVVVIVMKLAGVLP